MWNKKRVYDIKFWRRHIYIFWVSISWKVHCTFKFEMHEDHRLKEANAFSNLRVIKIYKQNVGQII